MIHRIPFVLDIFLLSSLALWQGMTTFATIISKEDWDRITGPHGLVFVLICGIIVIWIKSVKDDASRERRHRESIQILIKLNDKTATDLTLLSVASNEAQIQSTNAIMTMNNNIARLTDEISYNNKTLLDKVKLEKRE